MPSNKTIPIVVGVLAASAAIAGTVVALRSRRAHEEGDDDEAFSATKPSAPKKVVSKTSPVAVTEKPDTKSPADKTASAKETPSGAKVETSKPAVNATTKPTNEDNAASLLDEVLDELEPKSTPAQVPASASASASTVATADGRTAVPHLGLSFKVPNGWEVREELSPVPNVAMVTVWNPEFANAPNAEVPGAVPVIILSVEDIRGENLNLSEFKERSKELSLQQMLMMTGGAIQPVVRKDTTVTEGSFRHMLEYAQSMPPFFDISVINLLDVRNGIAYVFQIMANPKVMNDYKSTFMQIARDTIVTPMDSSALGFLKVNTGKVCVNVDSTWTWSYPSSGAADDGSLATFQLASSVKKEKITLYETSKVPQTEHKPRNEKTVNDVLIASAFDGTQERKVFSYGGFSLVVEPQQKAISFLPEALVVESIKSVKASSDAPKPGGGATFVTPEYGYQFNVVGGSRVVSTKVGKGTVVYAPLGVPQDPTKEVSPEEQGPTVTIRIGSPENDPDCMNTLEEWHSRIEGEAASSDITGIKIVDMKNQKCLTFTSKEMQEVGPGQKTEMVGNVYIFVRDGVTTLIRWETTRGQWRRYERDLTTFLESFAFVE